MAERLDRRGFAARLVALAAWPSVSMTATAAGWRTFEVVTRVDLGDAPGAARLWLPLPLAEATPYQRTVSLRFETTAPRQQRVASAGYRLAVQQAVWDESAGPRTATLTAVVATRDRGRAAEAPQTAESLAPYLRPTRLLPTDGIVRETALRIVAGARDDETRARRLYDWIVDHTFRDPAVEGCGLGDIRWMLESGSLGGKCADLNALFVGLARAVGLPARDVYGLRIAPSAAFRSLGRSGDVTTAQHCRAEVHLAGRGWVAVDPADVRKVVLEEQPGGALPLDDSRVRRARADAFGRWEMNWIAFNDAHDVVLDGAQGRPLPFLMYPHAEVGGTSRRGERPEIFRYTIEARDLQA